MKHGIQLPEFEHKRLTTSLFIRCMGLCQMEFPYCVSFRYYDDVTTDNCVMSAAGVFAVSGDPEAGFGYVRVY